MADLNDILERLDDKLDKIDARADERHEQTITRLTTIESNASHLKESHDKTKEQCDSHEKFVQRGYGIYALFSVCGLGWMWDYFQNHRGH